MKRKKVFEGLGPQKTKTIEKESRRDTKKGTKEGCV